MLNLNELDKTRLARVIQSGRRYTVGPVVDGYRVYRTVIVGHVREPEYDNPYYKPHYRPDDPMAPGHFIVEPHRDKIYNGLSKKRWLEKLRAYEMKSEPELFKPSPLDGYLGKDKPQEPTESSS